MIEIPAAALSLDTFTRRLDFLSIGTNDLIQYTLAIDRTDDAVAHLYDPLHPAVLQLVAHVIRGANKAGMPVAVCGEMAGDERLTRVLLGFGLRQFSMHPAHLLTVKQQVLKSDLDEVTQLAKPHAQDRRPGQAAAAAGAHECLSAWSSSYMRIDTEQLAQHLERGLKPLYTIYGEETLLALEAADRIRASARAEGYSEREVLTVESGFDWSRARHERQQPVAVRDQAPAGAAHPERQARQRRRRGAARAMPPILPPDTVTLISLPKLDRAQQSSGWFEALDAGRGGRRRQPRDGRRACRVARGASGTAGPAGRRADAGVPGRARRRQSAGGPPGGAEARAAVSARQARLLEQVRDAVLDVARYDVFKLGEALLAGDTRALRAHARQVCGAKARRRRWCCGRSPRKRARCCTCRAASQPGEPLPQLLREARVWGARAELHAQRAARDSPRASWRTRCCMPRDVDRMIKGLARGDVWDELLQLGLRLHDPPKRRRASRPNRGRIRRSRSGRAG